MLTLTSINSYGQKVYKGQIVLKQDEQLLNEANDGRYPWDKKWQEPTFINVQKGETVDIMIEETGIGTVFTISQRTEKGLFYKTKTRPHFRK